MPETNPQTSFCSLIENSLTTDKEDQFRDLFYIGVKHLTYNLEHIHIDKYQFQRGLISVANHARVDGAICKCIFSPLLGDLCLLDFSVFNVLLKKQVAYRASVAF